MQSQVETTERTPQSRLGKRPVPIPKGIVLTFKDSRLEVQGPQGKLSRRIPEGVDITVADSQATVSSNLPGRDAPRLQGLVRALVANMV